MTKEWYDKANRTAQDFSNKYPGAKMNTNCVVIHSTETTVWPGYQNGATAPNMTIVPDFVNKRVGVRQHFPANMSSRALVNSAGGVETNTLNVFQIELVGTCDPATHKKWGAVEHIYMPEAPDWFLQGVAEVLVWLEASYPNFDIVDGAKRGWGPYPSSYGASKYRLTMDEWRKTYGIVGHQHVPENSHGDPGNLPIARLIELTGVNPTPIDPVIEPPVEVPPKEYDKLDPASYPPKGPKAGTHITWLGQRLVAHGFTGYSVGPGPEWGEADRKGVEWFQKKQGWTGSDADGYPGKETLKRLNIAPVVVKPVADWFRLMSWNVSNNNKIGIARWNTRKSKVVKTVLDFTPHVFCSQENTVKAGKYNARAYIDSSLAAKSYKRVSGGDGRYIYIHTAHVKYIKGGVFTLKPFYKGDDKQAAWAVLDIKGERVLVTSYHLENEGASDSYRLAQLKSCFTQASAQAALHGVSPDNIFHAGDTNFRSSASVVAIEKTGKLDLYNQAAVQIDKGIKSFNGWLKSRAGFRIDYVWGSKNVRVQKADQRTSLFTVADHGAQQFWIGR